MNASRNAQHSREKALSRRLAPPLAFVLAICLLVICCYDSGYSGLPPTEKRYAAAKARIINLKRDEKNSKLREPWEKLAGEFRSIYDADPAWPNRAAALFRAAESLEELAGRSFAKSDARKAVECYETLALRHAGSRLADDALFRAARLRAAWLRDDKGALALLARLKKQYPRGDMIAEATALEKALKASAKGRTAPEAVAAASRREAQEDPPAATAARKDASAATKNDLPLRYRAAKSRMAALRGDPVKACWRQPWEDLREEFLRISQNGKKLPLAAGALFHAAVCQESLARCSNLSADFNQAQKLYLEVANTHPKSAVADDALLAAARLHAGRASGREKALDLLETLLDAYPKGDMAAEARRLRTALLEDGEEPPARRRNAGPPELQVLSWDSPNRNLVEIVLEMSAPAQFSTRLVEGVKGTPARLFLDFEDARVVNDVRKGVTVRGSLLQAVRVRDRKQGGATLQFDFREVRRFDTRSEDDPCRIVLSVAAGKAGLPRKGKGNGRQGYAGTDADQAPVRRAAALKTRQVSDMASQLGLTVRKVFIDAGHGGKDPGTSHNDVLERMVTLDVALRLGRLLESNGLEVVYSRRKDVSVSLSERTRKANAERADLFVSIHVNANDNARINGFETYYLDLASNPQAARVAMLENAGSDRRLGDMQCMLADVMLSARVEESRRLAGDIQRLSMFRLKRREYAVKNNGVKAAPFHVLLGAQMPAILVELGYCTNRDEARNLGRSSYRHALAEGLAEGILAYRNRLLKRRTAENSLTAAPPDAM